MATADPSPLWVVTSQQETVEQASNGNYVTGTRITFRTRSGAQGAVFVPATEYTVVIAKAAIDARAQAMETVHNLSGEG